MGFEYAIRFSVDSVRVDVGRLARPKVHAPRVPL